MYFSYARLKNISIQEILNLYIKKFRTQRLYLVYINSNAQKFPI